MDENVDLLAGLDPLGGSSQTFRYVLMDVFTTRPLEGNQLAVVTDARGVQEDDMQRVARELNLSETVFVLPARAGGDVRIRIFTPAGELPFAGHPVLGTAVLVGKALGSSAVKLETGRGLVPVRLSPPADPGGGAFGWMQQPIPTWEPFAEVPQLLAALGVERSSLAVEIYDNGPRHVYVELDSEAAVAALSPDSGALTRLGSVEANCFAGADARWKTRMFAPALGVPEDPATGSAAGPLAVHLSRHGRIAFGQEIEIDQGSEVGRPSKLYAKAHGSERAVSGVEVGGSAVVVGRGELWLG